MSIMYKRLIIVVLGNPAEAGPRGFDPDCESCEYFNGIGYVKSPNYCRAYAMVSILFTFANVKGITN